MVGVGALTIELLLVLLASRCSGVKGAATIKAVEAVGNSTAIGILMFSDYLLPFEIVGVFLLGAIVGAIVLAKTPGRGDLARRIGNECTHRGVRSGQRDRGRDGAARGARSAELHAS